MGLPARKSRREDPDWRGEGRTGSMEASEKFVADAPVATETVPPVETTAPGESADARSGDGRVSWRRAIAIWIGAALLGWAVIGFAVAGVLRLVGAS